MTDPLQRSVTHAVPGLVASLGAWGVVGGHCLPGPQGPVLWLTTTTDEARDQLCTQTWLPAQVRVLLLRHGVAPEDAAGIRLMFDTEQHLAEVFSGE